MTTKITLLIAALIIILGGYAALRHPETPAGQACTQEARLCPDGSYVGRSGPNCEFSSCPMATNTTGAATTTPPKPNPTILPYNSGVRGSVTIGPTCPVERVPPDPQCANKTYSTTLLITRAGDTHFKVYTESNKEGFYTAALPPGNYIIQSATNAALPRLNPESFSVNPNSYTTLNLIFDSGIR